MGGVSWRVVAVVAVVAGLTMPAAAQARDVRAAASVAGQLRGVTCTSGANCWAVGSLNTGAGFIEHWNGTAWQVVPSQNPPKSGSSFLDGVACSQETNCWAVGYHENTRGSATFPYAEHWNGKAWSEVAMPYPAHETLQVNLMRAVSCPAANLCFADGSGEVQKGNGQYSASLVERWTGSAWQIVPSPALPHSTTTSLQGLACASTRDCWATGDWLNQPNPEGGPQRGGALGYHWDGHQWTAARIQDVTYYKAADLYAVSCPAPLMCMASGLQSTGPASLRPYTKRWNGSSWVAAPLGPIPDATAWPQAVSCTTPQMCMATGYAHQNITAVETTLAERWNGSSWATVPSPDPPSADVSQLQGLACPQVTNCWAVGYWQSSSAGGDVLIEHWNGTAWTIAAS